MQMYVNYYTRDMMNEGDDLPIGIVLCADKSETLVRYTPHRRSIYCPPNEVAANSHLGRELDGSVTRHPRHISPRMPLALVHFDPTEPFRIGEYVWR